MNTQNIEKYYTKIAEKIDCIIHEEWSKVYIYSEVLKDVVKVYFIIFQKR